MASKIKTISNDPFVIRTGSLSLFIAMSFSGKTFLQRYLLSQLMKTNSMKWIFVITSTKFNNEWADVVGEKNVDEEFSETKINKLLTFLANKAKKGEQYPGLLILDDCMGSVQFNSPIFRKLAGTGRHYAGLTIWCSFQYYKAIPTVMRDNAAYMFLLNQVNEKVAKSLLEEKANLPFDRWQELQKYIEQETKNYGACVIQTHERERPTLTIRAPHPEKKFKLTIKKPRGIK